MRELNTAPGAVPCMVCDLVRQFAELPRCDQDGVVGRALFDKLRTIGRTAAFFGGIEAMNQLHDAAEACVGNDNSVGYWLNQMWDGIGGWWA